VPEDFLIVYGHMPGCPQEDVPPDFIIDSQAECSDCEETVMYVPKEQALEHIARLIGKED
jgi:hypothetical protein